MDALYPWLKAFHVAAAVTWIAGMLISALAITVLARAQLPLAPAARAALRVVRRWDFRITAPAMLVVWVLGMTLASVGGWYASPWLLIKLAIVFVLSGLHGSLSGTLRRFARGEPEHPPAGLLYAGPVILAAVLAVAVLVVVKPF